MSEYVFLFDLDATITKVEILPEISAEIGKDKEMRELTERAMRGEIPFERSFRERVSILKDIPVSKVRKIVENIPLNEQVAAFIRQNSDRCYVITGNLDIWIEDLMKKLGVGQSFYCSKAEVKDDRIAGDIQVIDKATVVNSFDKPFVAIGDGNNDADMIAAAEIGIGFGGVRDIAPAVLNTGTGGSFSLGIKHAREMVVSLDGDLLVHPDDLLRIMHSDKECACGTKIGTDNPMLMKTIKENGKELCTGFSREEGSYEWTGLAQVYTDRLTPGDRHVCDMLESVLPIEMEYIRTREIDTMNDYENAVKWIKNGYND